MDEDGFLYIKGRKKDLIVLASGQNVYPEDIEAVLRREPGVRDGVVVGLPKDGGSVEVHAALLLDDGFQELEVVRSANRLLAAHQQIQSFTVWPEDDFPRTHTLKVKKPLVLEFIQRQGSEAQGAPTTTQQVASGLSALQRVVASVCSCAADEVTPEKNLGLDLNLDSLGRVELLSAVEQELGVYIDESQVGPETTVAELQDLVTREAQGAGPSIRFYRWPLTAWCTALRAGLHRALVFPWLATKYRGNVTGLENLEQLEGPVMFGINHNGIQFDHLLLLKSLPRKWRRRMTYAAAAEITFGKWWWGILTSLLVNAFPLSRDTAVRPSLEHLGGLLDQGWNVGIFPEGEHRVGEEMLPFQHGAGLLAVECATPIVPVHVVSRGRPARGRLGFLGRRERVDIRIGAPLTFPSATPYIEATEQLEAAVKAL